jgi:hypothetical protein
MIWLESMKKRIPIWVALAWLSVSLLPRATYADARTHFRRGETAYQQANYEIAIQEWRKAYRLEKKPRIQHNLALAYERLGRLEEAAKALEIFLKSADPDDPAYGEATARLNSIKQRLALTGIQINCRVEGALIQVDGREWGRTPRPDKISVSPGSHDVVIRHPDYRDFISNVVVPAGQVVKVDVRMKPKDGPAEDDESEVYVTEPADQTRAGGGVRSKASIDSNAASKSLFKEPVFWYLLGAGSTVGAVGALLWTVDRHEELQGCDDTETYFCKNEDQVRNEQGAAFLIMTILAAGAIGSVVYGIVLHTSDDGSERASREGSVSAACSIAPVSAQCGLRF